MAIFLVLLVGVIAWAMWGFREGVTFGLIAYLLWSFKEQRQRIHQLERSLSQLATRTKAFIRPPVPEDAAEKAEPASPEPRQEPKEATPHDVPPLVPRPPPEGPGAGGIACVVV